MMDVASTMVEDTCQLYLSCETVEILSVVERRKEISTFLRITRKMSNGKKEKKWLMGVLLLRHLKKKTSAAHNAL